MVVLHVRDTELIATERGAAGMLAYSGGARSNPSPRARVVPLAKLRDVLPPDHPAVTPDQRREQLARRREAVWNRYR